MDFRIKEPLYVRCGDREFIIRANTVGVEKNKVVFFYDNTRYTAVGFPRDYCINNPQTFHVSRTLFDKDVPVRDIIKLLEELQLDRHTMDSLILRIKSL